MSNFTTWRSLVDGRGIAAIPDSEDLQARYDFSEYSGTSNFDDLTGNGYDLTNGSISSLSANINGRQAGEFDGVDDSVWSSTFSEVSEPVTFFLVAEVDDSPNDLNTTIQSNSSEDDNIFYDNRGGENVWTLNADSGDLAGGEISDILITGLYDGSNSILRSNGVQVDSGSVEYTGLDVLGLGSREPKSSDRYFDGKIGEVLVYPMDKSGSFDEIESYLADRWSINI